MIRKILLSVLTLTLVAPFMTGVAGAQIRHEVFLENTDHELNVYRIFGEEVGKTIMIIGGIQGDEPGGYMTADLYADIHLKKGNLIVVPRANFYSILLNRRNGLTGDMNRKFDPKEKSKAKTNLEDEVVAVLKHLIAESDCLLNLHEGSGFYSPKWISNQENPNRYGQSIIYDSEVFRNSQKNVDIELGKLAKTVVEKVNSQIKEKRYHFRPNNHDTISKNTRHPEQRKSATFYALTRAGIPAFGVETSKTIKSLETKIGLHKLVINTFMSEFGIILDSPGINVDQPKLDYLLVKINGGPSYALPHGSDLAIDPGDDVVVTDIIANYERGLVADVEGVGTRNDTNIPFRISQKTKIVVRKDALQCGWVNIVPKSSSAIQKATKISEKNLKASEIMVNVDDQLLTVEEGKTLKIRNGARITLKGIRTNVARFDSEVLLNFKGFAPPKSTNDGNDLHYPIYTDQDLWKRYSENGKGKRYPVVATYNEKPIGKFWIELKTN